MGSLLISPRNYSFSESSTEGAKYIRINVTFRNVGQTEIYVYPDYCFLYYRGIKNRCYGLYVGALYPGVSKTDTASFLVPEALQASECKFSIEDYQEPFNYKITWILE